MLILRRRAGETLLIGDNVKVTVMDVYEGGVRLAIDAPKSVQILRSELLQAEELKTLNAKKSEELYYYVMCTVKEPVTECTVNMKCPLAINPDTHSGMQVILEDDAWEMRHKLSEFEKQEDETC